MTAPLSYQVQVGSMVLNDKAVSPTIRVTMLQGWYGSEADVSIAPRPRRHASFWFPGNARNRILQMQGVVSTRTPAELDGVLEQLEAETAKVRELGRLTVYEAQPKHVDFLRLDQPLIRRTSSRMAEFDIVLTCPDPRKYSTALTTLVLNPDEPVPGRTYNREYPYSFGGGSNLIGSFFNAGTIETMPVVVVQGPATRPRLQNLDTGQQWEVDIVVPGGTSLTVDHSELTVLLNGSDRFGFFSGDFFGLERGSTSLRFLTDAGDGTCTITARAAYT